MISRVGTTRIMKPRKKTILDRMRNELLMRLKTRGADIKNIKVKFEHRKGYVLICVALIEDLNKAQ